MKPIRHLTRNVVLTLLVAIGGMAWGSHAATNNFGPKPFPERLQWWGEARFGMFIHYGPVSLTGKEISWSRANSNPQCPNKGPTPVEVYDNLYKNFNPTNFSAREWVTTGKTTGMKYVVLTAKHCDGFLLWNSKVDDYNIMHTPFRRDLCAELATAVRRENLRLGWYFSPMDWRDPDFRTERNAAFIPRMQGQLSELLRNYGRVDLLWFDWDAREPLYDQTNTYALVKSSQPRIIINNRLDLAKGDNDRMLKSPLADYYTPEQHIGAYDDQRPWETCMTLGRQWSWKPNDQIKSVAEVLTILARTVGGDGNLLLNVGPMPDGRIEPRQVEVLQQVGTWMKRNGESIYGTRGGPWKPTKEIASTRKGKTIYVHILKSTDGNVKLPNIPAKIRSARILRGGKVAFTQADGGIEFRLRPDQIDAGDTVIALRLDRDALALQALDAAPAEAKTK
jgi:alpha-L-fucosidase